MASDWVTITEEEALGGNQWETISEEEALGGLGQEKRGFVSSLIERPHKFLPFAGTLIDIDKKLSLLAAARRLEAANVDPDYYKKLTSKKVSLSGMVESPEKYSRLCSRLQLGGDMPINIALKEHYETVTPSLDKKWKKWTPERQKEYDIQLMEELAKEREKEYTWGGRVGQIVGEILAFATEIIATGGLYAAPKAAVTKALGGKTTAKVAGWAAGGALQATLGMSHRTAESFAERRLPKDVWLDEEGDIQFEWPTEKPFTSFAKAWGDTTIEVLSEQSGPAIKAVGGGVLKKLPFGQKFIGKLYTKYQKLHPNIGWGQFVNKLSNKAGYHGILEEVGEEYIGDTMRAIVGTEDFGAGPNTTPPERLVAALNQDIRNTPAMLAAFAIPGGARTALGMATGPLAKAQLKTTTDKIQKSKLSDFEKARLLQGLEKLGGPEVELSETAKRRLDTARKFETILIDLESKRPELKKSMKEQMGTKLRAAKEIAEDPTIEDPIQAMNVARHAMVGYAREQIPELAEQISRDEVADLLQAARESDLPPGQLMTLARFFDDIRAKVQPHKSGIKAFDKFFGTDIIKRVSKMPLTRKEKILRTAFDTLNMPKAIMCSCDFSAGGIQAMMVAPNHPIIWGKGVGKGYRAFFRPEYVDFVELEMQTNPHFKLIEEHAPGLITEIGSGTRGEEFFVSQLAYKIPGIGTLVGASDRAFVTTLNSIRANLFYQYMEKNPGASDVEIKEILDYIGNLTGRGRGKKGGRFEKYAPELGAVTWAPRLYLGQFKATFTDIVKKPHIRKIIAGDLVGDTAFLMSILALASLIPDVEVETNPLSSDFGKIKIGNTRIAFFGRHTQIIRLVAQLILGMKKSTQTGRIYREKRLEIVKDFLRGKQSPTTAIPTDIITGKTWVGKKWRWESEFLSEYFADYVTPMFIQDIKDAIKYQGWGTAFWTSPLAVHGVGVQTYEANAGSDSMNIKNKYAHQFYGTDWDELGPETQQALRETRPLIGLYEDRARIERTEYVHGDWIQTEQREAGRRVLKGLKNNIQSELDRLGLPFGGLSRRLNSDWFLNKKRYKQYQEETQQLINEVVPNLIEAPGWSDLDSMTQRHMLDELINECKKAVRQKIVGEAKMEDIERAMESAGIY